MLQQTQIPRVIPKYNEWIKKFPTLQALRKAPFSKVLHAWHGLGYNRRARYLKDTAEKIIKMHNNRIPNNPKILETLPGIGHYTARAVSCFAYGRCEPFVDTNIRRTFIHFFGKQKKNRDDTRLLSLIKKTEPKNNKRKWYGALMDYGRDALGKLKENPNKKSPAYQKQSPFLGSKRQMRAGLIAYLLHNAKGATILQIKKVLRKKNISLQFLSDPIFSNILASLKKENLIREKKKRLYIARR